MNDTIAEAVFEHIKSKHCSMWGRGYSTATDKERRKVAEILTDELIIPVLTRLGHLVESRPHRADPETWEPSALVAEVGRLLGECCTCESCGHVQAEPNWCHSCGHRVAMPEWATTLVEPLTRDNVLASPLGASESKSAPGTLGSESPNGELVTPFTGATLADQGVYSGECVVELYQTLDRADGRGRPSPTYRVVKADKYITISGEIIEEINKGNSILFRYLNESTIRINNEVTYRLCTYDIVTNSWKAVRLDG